MLWEVFPVRDRFLMFSCLLVISSRSSSFCVLWQVEANISKFLFRRRTLSWQLLQQNLGSSSLSKTSISHTLRIILSNCNAFPLSLKNSFFSWSSNHTTGTLNIVRQSLGSFHVSRQLERPPKKPRKFGTVKRANHSVCFITAQLLAGANEKWPCIHLYEISLFSVKQSEIWVRDYY